MLETEFSRVITLRADWAAVLEDETGLHIEWQGTRKTNLFHRMVDTWRNFLERFDDDPSRFRQIVVKMAGAPRDWVVSGRIGKSHVEFETVIGTDLDVTPLFEDGALRGKVLGCLFTKEGWRIRTTLEEIKSLDEPERSEALEMLQVALQLRSDQNDLPEDMMLDERVVTIDVARNPLTRPVFEQDLRGRTAGLLVALGHDPETVEQRLRNLDAEELDGLFKTALNVVKSRNQPEMVRKLEEELSALRP